MKFSNGNQVPSGEYHMKAKQTVVINHDNDKTRVYTVAILPKTSGTHQKVEFVISWGGNEWLVIKWIMFGSLIAIIALLIIIIMVLIVLSARK